MRRAVPVLAATGGVLVLLANFHTSPAPSGAADQEADSSTVTEPAPSTTTTVASTTTSIRATTTTAPTTSTTLPTFDGPVALNEWGPVQVRITLSGARIVDVQALRLPHDNSHSAALSREASPILRREALAAQSANIDLVSGATLTSQGYIESLQGALDRAGR